MSLSSSVANELGFTNGNEYDLSFEVICDGELVKQQELLSVDVAPLATGKLRVP